MICHVVFNFLWVLLTRHPIPTLTVFPRLEVIAATLAFPAVAKTAGSLFFAKESTSKGVAVACVLVAVFLVPFLIWAWWVLRNHIAKNKAVLFVVSEIPQNPTTWREKFLSKVLGMKYIGEWVDKSSNRYLEKYGVLFEDFTGRMHTEVPSAAQSTPANSAPGEPSTEEGETEEEEEDAEIMELDDYADIVEVNEYSKVALEQERLFNISKFKKLARMPTVVRRFNKPTANDVEDPPVPEGFTPSEPKLVHSNPAYDSDNSDLDAAGTKNTPLTKSPSTEGESAAPANAFQNNRKRLTNALSRKITSVKKTREEIVYRGDARLMCGLIDLLKKGAIGFLGGVGLTSTSENGVGQVCACAGVAFIFVFYLWFLSPFTDRVLMWVEVTSNAVDAATFACTVALLPGVGGDRETTGIIMLFLQGIGVLVRILHQWYALMTQARELGPDVVKLVKNGPPKITEAERKQREE
eukprot:CAMPEP_0182855736 /NCGR_PEP_ID=MMETSP0034_2-20130328/2019_1 /TAXON_ID=156128 /ORGANISM="Nephroselmis pyriformis, Strain CCMP717" /LENGTH=466 /DNA_ID=CAMNT_0024986741 /DNA_START=1 /DNA_END=1398 /DNA_ORIENTATION=-